MAEKPFTLSAKVLLRDTRGRILLIRRAMNSKMGPGKWDLPGGKVDAGEAFDAALLREVREETGLAAALERVAGVVESDLADRREVCLLMEGRRVAGDVRLSAEHDEHVWVERSALATVDACTHFRDFLARYAAG